MPDEQINIAVTATDDASQVLDDIAAKTDKLEDRTAKVGVDADTAKAEENLGAVADEAEKLDGTAVDIPLTTSGDTSGLTQAATDVDNLAGSAGAAGPGLAALDQGLGTAATAAGALAGPLAETSDSAATAIGAFGGLAGTVEQLAPSMGVSAENATRLSTALSVAGVAVGAGIAAWSLYQQKVKEASEETARIGEALGEVQSSLKEGDIGQAAQQMADAFPDLANKADQFGLSVEELTAGLRGNQQALIEQVLANENAGTAADGAGVALAFLLGQYNSAAEAASNTAVAEAGVAASFRDSAAAVNENKQALLDLNDARLNQADSLFALEDANRSFNEATAASTQAQNDYNAAVAQYGPTSQQAIDAGARLAQSQTSERDAAIAAANAELARQTALAETAGVTMSAEAQTSALNRSLLNSAQNATPAARAEIIRYIAEVNGISEKRATEIVANGDTAAAERELNDAARDRTATIYAKVVGSLDKAALAAAAGVPLGRAAAAPMSAMAAVDATAGPLARGMLADADVAAADTGGGSGLVYPVGQTVVRPIIVANTFKITNEVAMGANPVEVGRATVAAIRAFERAAGRQWRA